MSITLLNNYITALRDLRMQPAAVKLEDTTVNTIITDPEVIRVTLKKHINKTLRIINSSPDIGGKNSMPDFWNSQSRPYENTIKLLIETMLNSTDNEQTVEFLRIICTHLTPRIRNIIYSLMKESVSNPEYNSINTQIIKLGIIDTEYENRLLSIFPSKMNKKNLLMDLATDNNNTQLAECLRSKGFLNSFAYVQSEIATIEKSIEKLCMEELSAARNKLVPLIAKLHSIKPDYFMTLTAPIYVIFNIILHNRNPTDNKSQLNSFLATVMRIPFGKETEDLFETNVKSSPELVGYMNSVGFHICRLTNIEIKM